MLVDLPDHLVTAMGHTVFTGLIRIQPDGRLLLLIPIDDDDPAADPRWLTATVECPAARAFGADLALLHQPGGSA